MYLAEQDQSIPITKSILELQGKSRNIIAIALHIKRRSYLARPYPISKAAAIIPVPNPNHNSHTQTKKKNLCSKPQMHNHKTLCYATPTNKVYVYPTLECSKYVGTDSRVGAFSNANGRISKHR
jgi:hypothetical protein